MSSPRNTAKNWQPVTSSKRGLAKEAKVEAKEQKKSDIEDAKWVTLTPEEYRVAVAKKTKFYAIERDGKNFKVKVSK